MRRGFTLVELSIVLVIIGLLIGGILVAQSLIETARLNRAIGQIQQFDIAVSNFQTSYNCLPGDCSTFYSSGNNDGSIYDLTQDDASFTGEIANFWKNLSETGLKSETGGIYSTSAPGGASTKIHMPEFQMGEECGVVAGKPSPTTDATLFAMIPHNLYSVRQFIGTTSDFDTSTCLKVSEALGFDRKIDDGLTGTGNVIGMAHVTGAMDDLSSYTTSIASDTKDCFLNSDNSRYNVASTFKNPCGLVIKILSQR